MIAHGIDEIIGGIFFIPLIVFAIKKISLGEEIYFQWKWILALSVSRFVYEALCLNFLQALPGQYFLGLRVISVEHPELGLGFGQCLVRVFVEQLKYLVGPSIYYMALFHKERQHIGDLLSESRVVQEHGRPQSFQMRYILGSILVYLSLVSHLGEAVQKFSEGTISSEGVHWSLAGWLDAE